MKARSKLKDVIPASTHFIESDPAELAQRFVDALMGFPPLIRKIRISIMGSALADQLDIMPNKGRALVRCINGRRIGKVRQRHEF